MAIPIQRATPTIGVGAELGVTNPQRSGATLYEDFLPQLRGRRAALVYEEMASNDATVGAILYAVEQLVRQVEWTVESDNPQTLDFLTDNLDGLAHSWDDFISAVLSEITYGWSMFETVYRLEDGRVWWDKFAFRTQQSLHRWVLAPSGELEAFVQTLSNGTTAVIPAEKLVHFRTSTGEGRPEGRSWLRRAYRSWFFKKYAEDQTAIGISRDLTGMPKGSMPAGELLEQGDAYEVMKKVVTGMKVDELQGVLLPSDIGEDGQRLFDIELMSTSGRPKTDSLAFIRTQAQDIASVMLAQFIGLGRDTVGSRALAEPQQELFQTALTALLDSIEEQFHRQATKRLLELNGLESGRVVHREVRDLDLEGIGSFVLRIAQAGVDVVGPEGEGSDELLEMAGLQPHGVVIVEDENTDTFDPSPGTN